MSEFLNRNNKRIYWDCVEGSSANTDVLLLHGMSEHSGRYDHLAKKLLGKGFNVYWMDHVGHGRSEGERGKIDSFQEYIDDVNQLVEEQINSKRPLYIFGHSMGSLVAIHYVLQNPEKVKRLAITGTCLFPGASIPPFLVKISTVVSKLWPSGRIVKLKPKEIAKSVATQESYVSDVLVSNKPAPNWTGLETYRFMLSARERLNEINIPLHIQHGGADRIVDPKGSRLLYECAGTDKKNLLIHEGYRHEIMNEEIREEVVNHVLDHFLNLRD